MCISHQLDTLLVYRKFTENVTSELSTAMENWLKNLLRRSAPLKKEVGGFEILDGIIIGASYFSKDGQKGSVLICPPIWAFNYGVTNAFNRLSHPASGPDQFQSMFNSLLDELVSEVLIYLENRLKIIVVNDKLKYKINSIPGQ